jgi:hypothetical protein
MNKELQQILNKLMHRITMQDLDFFKCSTREIIQKALIDAYECGMKATTKEYSKYVEK